MSEHHQHQHVVMAVGSGGNIEQAIFNAVAGLTDPKGHHGGLTFDAFEVLNIKGTISHKPGDHGYSGTPPSGYPGSRKAREVKSWLRKS
jgi:hypothetical protein